MLPGTKIIEANLAVAGPITEDQYRRLEELTGREPERFKAWAATFHFDLPTDADPHQHPAVTYARAQDLHFTLEIRSERVVGEVNLDAAIDASWERRRAESEVLEELILRRIARTVLEAHPQAATLHLVIRDPDKIGMPNGWSVDEDGVRDAEGRALVDDDPVELEDQLNDDLRALAELDEVMSQGVIDLSTDPPALSFPTETRPLPMVPVAEVTSGSWVVLPDGGADEVTDNEPWEDSHRLLHLRRRGQQRFALDVKLAVFPDAPRHPEGRDPEVERVRFQIDNAKGKL